MIARTVLPFVFAVTTFGCIAEPTMLQGSHVDIIRAPELQPWARFPEREAGFRAVDVAPDTLVFTFDGRSPLEVGTVVAGEGGVNDAPYVRKIDALEDLGDG